MFLESWLSITLVVQRNVPSATHSPRILDDRISDFLHFHFYFHSHSASRANISRQPRNILCDTWYLFIPRHCAVDPSSSLHTPNPPRSTIGLRPVYSYKRRPITAAAARPWAPGHPASARRYPLCSVDPISEPPVSRRVVAFPALSHLSPAASHPPRTVAPGSPPHL